MRDEVSDPGEKIELKNFVDVQSSLLYIDSLLPHMIIKEIEEILNLYRNLEIF